MMTDTGIMSARELVAGLIIRDGRLFLVHNIKHNSMRIEPPGGKRHDDESREQAVMREVMEEVGLVAGVSGLFGVYETSSPEGDFVVYTYFCEVKGGEPALCEPHCIGGFGWYTYEEIEALASTGTLAPNMRSALGELKILLSGC